VPSLNAPDLAAARALSRRAALRLIATGVAALGAGCSRPHEEIVADETLPYVNMPEGLVPGLAQRYATSLPLAGYARGALVTAVEGRPIKVEGNPRHPASRGASDVFAQAEILSLYDPDRAQAIRRGGEISEWPAFEAALREERDRRVADKGAGLRLLTGRISSPTLLGQIAELMARYPAMRWHVHEPTDDGDAEAARAVFGRPLALLPRPEDAAVVVALQADPLGPGPGQVRFGAAMAARRGRDRVGTRLHAAESVMTLTGAAADRRLTADPDAVARIAVALCHELGADVAAPTLAPDQQRFVAAAVADLRAHSGAALIVAGPSLPDWIRALAHWTNDHIGAPVDAFEIDPRTQGASLADLGEDLRGGKVDTLVVIDANPAHTAPGDLDFEPLLKKARLRIHLGLYDDETATVSDWRLPMAHALESWSDLATPDGVAGIVQPLIRPLFGGVTAHALIAALAGEPQRSDYARLRDAWKARWGDEGFEARWRQALLDGVAAGAPKPATKTASPPTPAPLPETAGMTALFLPDPAVFDGRYANNAWLQECPRPFSKSVWGNSVAMAPEDARRLGLEDGDEVRISANGRSVVGPVRLATGAAAGTIALTLGYGRHHAGAIGDGIGFNVAPLRASASPWIARGVVVERTGRRNAQPPSTFGFFALEGEAKALAPEFGPHETPSLPPADPQRPGFATPSRPTGPYAWAMVVDTDSCIGCNACVVACQSENNVPVVGPEEIALGRDMHWLRIDLYDHGDAQAPRPVFQPVPCMHCETAPCEPVCPVEASVHDHEGLNVQVYNRCVGTRFCEANCPYKVRRFNFFGYADGEEYSRLGDPLVKAANNPDVSVRARGVMEKCTYCVQRISRARRDAEREMRDIAEGEVTTACQAACPTRAIHFGNLADPASDVSRLRRRPDHYGLLANLGTRPRTTYLARRRDKPGAPA
jgi:molybdopterin-containing oxidoreductase family iron-sulfur binding subunit